MKKQMHLYGHDFEVIVIKEELFFGKYRATVNYLQYPDHFGFDFGFTEEEAIDKTVRKILATSPLESLKHLY
ncbi:hypothetical protein [Solibacillus cecembensis]|uniref:hypothetical protein n=1 Tax=Solibacillus cecembensis TaxID=459347 RepID=UPI0007174CC9